MKGHDREVGRIERSGIDDPRCRRIGLEPFDAVGPRSCWRCGGSGYRSAWNPREQLFQALCPVCEGRGWLPHPVKVLR
jgi:DnaJ-class molecular chaperone